MKKLKISRATRVGIYGVSMFVLLYLGLNFIKNQDIFSRDNTYYAVYAKSDGIQASSPVTIKGFRVGTVDNVRYEVESAMVIVEFSVNNEYPVPDNSEAKIMSASIMGGKVVELNLGDSPQYMASGDTIPSMIDPGVMQLFTSEYDKLKVMAETLLERVSKALDGVNAVLSEQNVANLSEMLENLNSASDNVDRMVSTDLKETMRNINNLSAELNTSAPKITNLVDKMSGLADTMSISMPTLMANTSGAMDKLNTTLQAINSAEGTAGKLIYDKKLYGNLTEASQSLTILLQDLKVNPKRYVHFSLFGGGTKNKDKESGDKSKESKRKSKSKDKESDSKSKKE